MLLIYWFLQTVKTVAEAAPVNDLEERLLVHICYSPRRCVHRNLHIFSSLPLPPKNKNRLMC